MNVHNGQKVQVPITDCIVTGYSSTYWCCCSGFPLDNLDLGTGFGDPEEEEEATLLDDLNLEGKVVNSREEWSEVRLLSRVLACISSCSTVLSVASFTDTALLGGLGGAILAPVEGAMGNAGERGDMGEEVAESSLLE